MIELRKYIARVRSSKRTCIYSLVRAGGGGRVYEIETLHSNLALEERRGRLFEGGVLSSRYGTCTIPMVVI